MLAQHSPGHGLVERVCSFFLSDSASVSLTVEEGDMTILNSAAAGVELQVTLGCRLIGVDN